MADDAAAVGEPGTAGPAQRSFELLVPPHSQASGTGDLIVLAMLRHDHRLADMADGNGVSASTIHRWTWEVIGLLAARALRLDRALATIRKQGGEAVLLDGTLIPTCRRSGTANRRSYNGKHKKHGLLFLALTDQAGNLTWISPARRGAASEITAARHDHLAARLRAAGLGALADLGFTGLDPDPADPVIITGYKSTPGPQDHPRPAPPTRHCPPPVPPDGRTVLAQKYQDRAAESTTSARGAAIPEGGILPPRRPSLLAVRSNQYPKNFIYLESLYGIEP